MGGSRFTSLASAARAAGALAILGLILSVPAPAQASLGLAMAINPDPAEPGETLDLALTVTNTSAFDRTGVLLQLRYPEHLNRTGNDLISDGGACTGCCCETAEFLTWSFDVLPAGTSKTVTLPPRVLDEASAGTVIELAAEVTDASGAIALVERSMVIRRERTLELALGEAIEPVQPGGPIRYTLSYGFSMASSLLPEAFVELLLPPGARFVSASDGGQFNGIAVRWPLGDVMGGQVGRHDVLLELDSGVSLGSMLIAQALFSGNSSSIETPTRASTITRVEAETPLALALAVSPDATAPGQTFDVALTVTNTSAFDRTDVLLQLRYPEHLNRTENDLISDGGACEGCCCESLEFLNWSFDVLPAGTSRTVTLPPSVAADAVAGTIIEFDAVAADATARSRAEAALKVGDLEPAPLVPYQWQVQQMYIAYYGRPGDPAGVDYWAGRLADAGGEWIADLIDAFGRSAEYTDRFGALGDETLIENLFLRLFNRSVDSEGLRFYVDLLNGSNVSGFNPDLRQSTLAQIALDVANGAPAGSDDRLILDNKLAVAEYFTNRIRNSARSYGAAEIETAVGFISEVGLSPASVNNAKTQIDAFLTS